MGKIKKITFNRWPRFTQSEIAKVTKIIKSGKVNYWTGNYCTQFENNFKLKFGLNHAISVANGSVALDAAVSVLNLKKNDEVLVTSRSYVSTASCIQQTPAKIKFIDVDINSQNINLESIRNNINSKTKLIICAHLAGWPCDIRAIKKIIGDQKIYIIEDCSQAHGAKIDDYYVGSIGDISVWSFCNDKIMSTLGEGGMISCKSTKLYKKLWAYKDCGKNLDKINKKSKNQLFKWLHDYDGTNLRMTEIQAAVGIEQLKKLNSMVSKRYNNLKILKKKIINNKIIIPDYPKNIIHSGYRFYLYLKNPLIRNEFIQYLNKNLIDANQGSCPEIYKERRFSKKQKFKLLENANKLGKICVSLPSHHLISKKNLNYMIEIINKF